MKLRSAPLDDVFQEVQFTLDDDGGRLARAVRRSATWTYRLHKVILLVICKFPWRRGALTGHPEVHELFTLSDKELEQAWRQR
jgi:hypothetical protein